MTPVKTGATSTSKTISLDKDGNVVGEDYSGEKVTVLVSISDLSATPIVIMNKAGTVLPSTGGIGTTIFYIVGGILAAGAAIVLVAKKRVNE